MALVEMRVRVLDDIGAFSGSVADEEDRAVGKVPDSDWIFGGFMQKNLDFLSGKAIFGIIKY